MHPLTSSFRFNLTCQAVSFAICSARVCSLVFIFSLTNFLRLPSTSLCRITGSCRGVVWLSWLHCPLIDPTKAQAQTPLTFTSVLSTRCPSAGLIPYPRNSWPTWQKVEGQTCAPWAPTCSVCRELDLPTTLRGQRPQCEHKHSLWVLLDNKYSGKDFIRCVTKKRSAAQGSKIYKTNMFTHIKSRSALCGVHPVHFLGYTWVDNPLDVIALTRHTRFYVGALPVLGSWKFPFKLLLEKVRERKGNDTCRCIISCTMELSGSHVSSLVFRILCPQFQSRILACSPTCLSFLLRCTFMYSMWSSQVRGSRRAPPSRCACMCVSVCMNLPVTVCLYGTHLCLTGNHTAAG